LSLAVEAGTPRVTAFLPGGNDAVLSAAVACGMRIRFPMVMMSTRAFPEWTQYLPRNPGFM
jgi:hypothetical protein